MQCPVMQFRPGDLLFFYGQTWQSRVIEAVTRGPSHVGICSAWYHCCQPVVDGETLLFESTTLCDLPDLLLGEKIDGVQVHRPAERIDAYQGRICCMRLADGWELEKDEEYALRNWLHDLHGKPYDLEGALASGTRLFKWLPLMPYPDLGHLFCSELCAELLMRLHRLPLGDPGVYNPASLMDAVRRCASYRAPEIVSSISKG